MKKQINSLIIRGNPNYIGWMYHHLRKEHPSVIGKIRITKHGKNT